VALSFIVGVRAAAPAMVALLSSVLILGLISRTLPQLNVIAVGFSLNAMVMLAVLSLSLGGVVWAFQDEVGPTLALLRDALATVEVPQDPKTQIPNPLPGS
jgi:flagellar biosynthetic protein FliR